MGRYGNIDYPTVTKRTFLLGVSLFVLGILGDVIGQMFFGPLPAWEETLFLGAEGAGILVAVVFPILFGIVLPLTE